MATNNPNLTLIYAHIESFEVTQLRPGALSLVISMVSGAEHRYTLETKVTPKKARANFVARIADAGSYIFTPGTL